MSELSSVLVAIIVSALFEYQPLLYAWFATLNIPRKLLFMGTVSSVLPVCLYLFGVLWLGEPFSPQSLVTLFVNALVSFAFNQMTFAVGHGMRVYKAQSKIVFGFGGEK